MNHLNSFTSLLQICMQSPGVTCVSSTLLQDRWEQFILNYKFDGANIKPINHQRHLT
jgi:hypothetical protein